VVGCGEGSLRSDLFPNAQRKEAHTSLRDIAEVEAGFRVPGAWACYNLAQY
jgi:hypothetical protein